MLKMKINFEKIYLNMNMKNINKHIMFILIRLLIELDRFKSYIQIISEQSIQFESKKAIYLKLFLLKIT
jgi:hypothetical protein